MKKKIAVYSVLLFGLLAAAGIAWVGYCPTLPTSPIMASHAYPGTNSFFNITFSGIPAEEPSDVLNGVVYPGWCLEDNHMRNTVDPVTLHCSLAMGLPGNLGSFPWDRINYLLNHKIGTWREVQAAMWMLTLGVSTTFPVTPNAQAMIDDALANGGGFVPTVGQVVGVIVYTGDGGLGFWGVQDTLIEIPVAGTEGCTPGFWKNHPEAWAETGFSLPHDFDPVFGTNYSDPNITLNQAIRLGGGGINVIARHGTAALLSAAHPDVYYPYSVETVIAIVRGGVQIELLVTANELGCYVPERN